MEVSASPMALRFFGRCRPCQGDHAARDPLPAFGNDSGLVLCKFTIRIACNKICSIQDVGSIRTRAALEIKHKLLASITTMTFLLILDLDMILTESMEK